MADGTKLLNEDGTASMATALMMSHHAFRRDLARFRLALSALAKGERLSADAIREEWQSFRGALHGHHTVEDTAVFPDLEQRHPEITEVIARLQADHRQIDPILARGDLAFAELPRVASAFSVVATLTKLLDDHLRLEEETIAPLLRNAKAFPPATSEEEAALYAEGFAWSSHGIAADVLEKVDAMLPHALSSRLPAARAQFAERCKRVWGTSRAGASHTSVPDQPFA